MIGRQLHICVGIFSSPVGTESQHLRLCSYPDAA